MANSIYQGKIIRQFWGKIIRQSTIFLKLQVYNVLPGGGQLNYQNGSLNNTFFHYDIRAG